MTGRVPHTEQFHTHTLVFPSLWWLSLAWCVTQPLTWTPTIPPTSDCNPNLNTILKNTPTHTHTHTVASLPKSTRGGTPFYSLRNEGVRDKSGYCNRHLEKATRGRSGMCGSIFKLIRVCLRAFCPHTEWIHFSAKWCFKIERIACRDVACGSDVITKLLMGYFKIPLMVLRCRLVHNVLVCTLTSSFVIRTF